MNSTFNKNKLVLSIFTFLTILLMYPLVVFDSINKYNPVNFILYMFSVFIMMISLNSIIKNNIKSYNIISLFFFTALFFNTINLSTKQLEKTEIDLYFFLAGPVLVFFLLFFLESLKINKLKLNTHITVSVDQFYIYIVIFYVILKVFIGYKSGFRVFTYGDVDSLMSGNRHVIPGYSGVAGILQWTMLILLPYVKRRNAAAGVLSILILSGILNVKRGDIIRVVIFLLILFSYINISQNKLTLSKIIKIILGFIVMILVFIIYGEYRMLARGADAGVIIDFLGSRVDSVTLSWLYSYISFNFEVLKLYYDVPHFYSFEHIKGVFGANVRAEDIGLKTTINGFNAGTYLSVHVLDFGRFYLIQLVPWSLLIGFFIFIAKSMGFKGLYVFILTLMSLMVFGDYFINRSVICGMIFSIIVYPFLELDKSRNIFKGMPL